MNTSWQDVVIGVVQWIFALALVPSIAGPHKPAFETSMITMILLLVLVGVYVSLGLYAAALCTFLCACGWGTLARQRCKRDRP